MTSTSNSRFESLESWLSIYGTAEYVVYKREATTPHLSYEDWASSQHVLGPYLYHLTLDAWEQESSSDGDDEEPKKPVKPDSSEQLMSELAETVTKNGNGTLHPLRSTTPVVAILEEPTVLVKKRKQKGKYKRPISIPPENINASAPVTGAATPVAAAGTSEGPSTSSAPRRTLRVRTPAQQRPYLHHAKLFQEQLSADEESFVQNKLSPKAKPSRLSQTSTSAFEEDPQDDSHDQGNGQTLEELASSSNTMPIRRRWKKTVDEEDDDYVASSSKQMPSEKKPSRRGRPRKVPRASLPDSWHQPGSSGEDQENNALTVEPASEKKHKKKGRSKKLKDKDEGITAFQQGIGRDGNDDHEDQENHGTPISPLKKARKRKTEKRGSDASS
ncbi:uncharacterized protein BDR25DRAFT_73863 [Lindgomyces ingoldianus]|uniref:Uncharacterized protein n=1 Tax=Lindgomyces ingoldianus TaxID=673940 RepID=A0ACB6QIK7_9PLEO|nr:uncharacterized protein BDR25DRAFT_73863 [Lindgomyces ingoldianus]KAF2466697.1 hypothetical protein BDR25DRAFT_73863 [Lindgomyces ingoldianus]